MYRGKRVKPMSKKKKCCMTLALSGVLLVSTLAIRPTVAYLIDTSPEVENTFQYGWVSCEIHEKTDGTTKSNVTVKNTGNTEAYIRATIVITFQNEDGEVYGPVVPTAGDDYILDLTVDEEGSAWFEGTDGYYYYSKEVSPNGYTGVLIESCTSEATAPSGYTLSVEILADAIQSNPDYAVEESWLVVDADNGTLTAVTS